MQTQACIIKHHQGELYAFEAVWQPDSGAGGILAVMLAGKKAN